MNTMWTTIEGHTIPLGSMTPTEHRILIRFLSMFGNGCLFTDPPPLPHIGELTEPEPDPDSLRALAMWGFMKWCLRNSFPSCEKGLLKTPFGKLVWDLVLRHGMVVEGWDRQALISDPRIWLLRAWQKASSPGDMCRILGVGNFSSMSHALTSLFASLDGEHVAKGLDRHELSQAFLSFREHEGGDEDPVCIPGIPCISHTAFALGAKTLALRGLFPELSWDVFRSLIHPEIRARMGGDHSKNEELALFRFINLAGACSSNARLMIIPVEDAAASAPFLLANEFRWFEEQGWMPLVCRMETFSRIARVVKLEVRTVQLSGGQDVGDERCWWMFPLNDHLDLVHRAVFNRLTVGDRSTSDAFTALANCRMWGKKLCRTDLGMLLSCMPVIDSWASALEVPIPDIAAVRAGFSSPLQVSFATPGA